MRGTRRFKRGLYHSPVMNKTIVAIIFLSTTNQLFFVKLVLIFRGGGGHNK